MAGTSPARTNHGLRATIANIGSIPIDAEDVDGRDKPGQDESRFRGDDREHRVEIVEQAEQLDELPGVA